MVDLHERFRDLDQLDVPPLSTPQPHAVRFEAQPKATAGSRLVAASVAALISAAAIGFLIRAFDRDAQAPATASPSAAQGDQSSIEMTIVAEAEVANFPNAVATDSGGVWVSSRDLESEGGVLTALNPAGQYVTSIPFGSLPGWEFGGGGIATGLGAVWIAGQPRPQIDRPWQPAVTRIDPQLRKPTNVYPIPDVHFVADLWVDATGVWVLAFIDGGTGTVVRRLDPDTGAETASIPVPASWSQVIFASGGSIWVYGTAPGDDGPVHPDTLYRIDPEEAELVETIALGKSNGTIASDSLAIWDRVGDTVLRVDPEGEGISAPIRSDEENCCSLLSSDGDGGLWTFGRSGDRAVAMHVTAEGVIDARGEAAMPKRVTEGVARAFDPVTQTLWIVSSRGPVTGVRFTLSPVQ